MNRWKYIISSFLIIIVSLTLFVAFADGSPKGANYDNALTGSIEDFKNDLKQEPFSEVPLVKLGAYYFNKQDVAKTIPLLEKAQKINPRNREAALALMAIYFNEGRNDEALNQMDLLFRLNPAKVDEHVKVLSIYANQFSDWAPILQRVEQRPKWAKVFVNYEIENGANQQKVLGLLLSWAKAQKKPQDSFSEQKRFLQGLLKDEQYDLVKTYRDSFLETFGYEDTVLFDTRLEHERGAPIPIGWKLYPDRQDFVEYMPDNGLYVGYRGKETLTLLSQMFWLESTTETINLTTRYKTNSDFHGVKFEWNLGCQFPKYKIASIPFNVSANFITQSVPVSVEKQPCSAYTLKLIGSPGERIKENTLIIKQVSITPTLETSRSDFTDE